MRLEVRCCCDPGKLLGWLDVRRGDFVAGARIKLARLRSSARLEFGRPALEQLGPATVVLTVAWISDGDGVKLAIKSDDTPIDVLRSCPAFIPNHEEISYGK